jgi:hypothetical protein
MKLLCFVILACVISAGIFTQSCSTDSIFEIDNDPLASRTDRFDITVSDFKNWFVSQTISSDFIGSQEPNWDNAEVKTMPDGKTQFVSIEIYKGENSAGSDSIRKLQIAFLQDDFTGGIKVYSYYNSEYASTNYYSLTGDLLEEGIYYPQNQTDVLLKRHTFESTQVRLKSGSESNDPCAGTTWLPNTATPYSNSDGPGCTVPGRPNWYNCPNISGSGLNETIIPLVGDRCVSYGYISGFGAVGAVHSAIVKETVNGRVTKVEAKCGEAGICIYNPDCPTFSSYKTSDIRYYR